jgi:hypothetical protein
MKIKTYLLSKLLLLLLTLTLICTGCSIGQSVGYVPPLEITGDVAQPIVIRSLSDLEMVNFQKGDRKYRGVRLLDLVESAAPVSGEHTLLLTAPDGLAAEIDGAFLESSYIVFSSENGWEAVHLHHPPSAAVKHLERIVVVSKTPAWDESINIIQPGRNLRRLTPGKLFAAGLRQISVVEGSSQQQAEGRNFTVSVYTRRLGVPVTEVLGNQIEDGFYVFGANGKVMAGQTDGFIQWRGHELRYVSSDGRSTVDSVVGIMQDPPAVGITDLYAQVVDNLDKDENILVILLDGFGYHQFAEAKERGAIPFMGSLTDAEPALSVYRPVTNAGMAAMLTGQWPDRNGVNFRERELAVPTFFQHVLDKGKTAVLLEGSMGILQTEISATLHLDLDGSGDSDDEIFAAAMTRMTDHPDVMMVHFHSIDDAGHDHGDMHAKVFETIRRNDDYVKALVEAWSGPVYILADHGMHAKGDLGYHGVFRYEDMVVPFIITEGGQTQ